MIVKTIEEIYFKGKRCDNGEWVYGYYVYTKDDNKHWILKLNEYKREVIEVSIGQYTGTNDLKRTPEFPDGQPVFSGDIVKYYLRNIDEVDDEDNFVYALIRYNGTNRFTFVVQANSLRHIMEWHSDQMVVIGNQMDNPELLKYIWFN